MTRYVGNGRDDFFKVFGRIYFLKTGRAVSIFCTLIVKFTPCYNFEITAFSCSV